MPNSKDLLRHEIVNRYVILSMMLDNSDLSVGSKNEMRSHLDFLTLITKYESVFLGEKLASFAQKVPFSEVLELSFSVHSEIIQKKGIQVKSLEGEKILIIDRHYLERGIFHIIGSILEHTNTISFDVSQKNTIVILHDIESEEIFKKTDLQDFITAKKPNITECLFQIGLRILEDFSIEISFAPQKTILTFPEEMMEE